MQSPLRYPGGKAKLFRLFSELIGSNNLYDRTYVEPYAGGSGLALKLLGHGFVKAIEINDIDVSIAAFWRSVLSQTDAFCALVADTPLSVAEWQRQKAIYGDQDSASDLERGFAAFYLNRTSRSGIIEGSGPIGGYKQSGVWTIDARFNRKALVNHITELARFADHITVSNEDAVKFAEPKLKSPQYFTYLDPPYYVKGRKLYKNFYKDDDHAKIAKLLLSARAGAWVLSYDFNPRIAELYSDFSPLIYSLLYSAGPVAYGTEVIYTGDAIDAECAFGLLRAA